MFRSKICFPPCYIQTKISLILTQHCFTQRSALLVTQYSLFPASFSCKVLTSCFHWYFSCVSWLQDCLSGSFNNRRSLLYFNLGFFIFITFSELPFSGFLLAYFILACSTFPLFNYIPGFPIFIITILSFSFLFFLRRSLR